MKLHRLTLICLVIFTVIVGGATAEERSLEFLNALRDKGYHDYAVLYLEQLQAQPQLPEELRQILPLEKALTLLQDVQPTQNSQEQHRKLDQALADLQLFLKQYPDHERAAQANSQLGSVLVERGNVDVAQANFPTNSRKKSDFEKQARDNFQSARDVFTKALEKHKAAYEQFETYIDKQKDSQRFEEKQLAELKYIDAMLKLAQLSFFESQAYEKGSKEQQGLLRQAIDEFEVIHVKHRHKNVDLPALLYQGKCYQELGEITQAMGIYNTVLDHPGTNEILGRYQDEARWYRLMLLNQERKDYQLVLAEADEWMKERLTTVRYTRVHMGILWEQALALEALAEDEKTDASKKSQLLRQAKDDLKLLQLHSAEFRKRANDKLRLIEGKLNIEGTDPTDFGVALGLGKSMTDRLSELNGDLQSARESGDKQAETEAQIQLETQMTEAARILGLALRLANEETDIKELNRARYYLGLADYYLEGRKYDAAVLGDFIATRYATDDPVTARDAAYMSMWAYLDIYNAQHAEDATSGGEADDEVELQNIIRMATLLTTHWPTEEQADNARLRLGELYGRLTQHIDSAEYFSQIKKGAPQYLEGQMKAGQAYWKAYVQGATSKSAERAEEQTTQAWLQQARQHLRESIDEKQQNSPDPATADYDFLAAKLTLAMIYNETGDFPAAVELLSGKPIPILEQVATEEARPSRGVKSENFASAAYQQAMRAYVGTRDIELAAQSVLKDLEKLGGGQNLVNQLVQLGKQLQEEVERLRSRNDPRLPDVIQSFEEFLNAMYQRENQTLQSLFWIGLTYYDLGQGLSNGKVPAPPESVGKFARSAEVFSDALSRCAADPQLANPAQISDIKLRLVRALRRQGQFADAQKIVTEILTERPRATDTQHEAAMIFTDWATADPEHAVQHLDAAIAGVTPDGASEKVIWGWGLLSQKLMLAILGGNNAPEIVEMFAESRYWQAVCLRRQGLAQSKTDEQVRLLELAILDINSTISAGADISATSRWKDFGALYTGIHNDLGRPNPPPLKIPQRVAAGSPPVPAGTDKPETETVTEAAVASTSEAAQSSNLTLIIAGCMTLGFVAVMTYLIFAGGKKKKRSYR